MSLAWEIQDLRKKLKALTSGLISIVTFESLQTNGDIGTGANQVAVGNHTHSSFITLQSGDKSSSLDAGTIKDISLGDDYLYICTQTGTAGNAIWKKIPLFKST